MSSYGALLIIIKEAMNPEMKKHLGDAHMHFNPVLGPLIPIIFIGVSSIILLCVTSVGMSTGVSDTRAKNMTIVVAVFFVAGIVVMCIWGRASEETRKKFGKALYIGMIAAFLITVICDILALVWWDDLETEHPKGVTIAQFVVTMILSVALSVLCAFWPKFMKKSE